eukprot:1136186-Pelagomonas_calceolata.AAC.5
MLIIILPWGHVLPETHQTNTSFPLTLVRETHGSLSQRASLTFIDAGSALTAYVNLRMKEWKKTMIDGENTAHVN